MENAPLSVDNLIGEGLRAIWAVPEHQPFCHRGFLTPRQIHPGTLLFIGINPSYTEADTDIQYYDAQPVTHPYFKGLAALANDAGQRWTHLDLLYFRETQQATLDEIIRQPAGLQFIWEQLQLFPTLLAAARPSVIVVANARARTLLGADADYNGRDNQWLGLKFEWDEKLGTHRYNGIPIFFTSMLSGQRALDKGSRERLAWHIRQAVAATC